MNPLNVQFSDSTETRIQNYFCGTQDADLFPNQGMVTADDERWLAFYEAAPDKTGLPKPPSLDT
jgi:hypothetical protein